MNDKREKNEVGEVLLKNLAVLATPDGFQKYMLGTKKNGEPRAVYDVIKECTDGGKKKKKKKKKSSTPATSYSFYVETKKKDKKKKKKDKNKHWHI